MEFAPYVLPSLYCVVQEGNKANHPVKSLWKFRIAGIDEVLGYMPNSTRKDIIWDQGDFCLDDTARTITLTPKPRQSETVAEACYRALSTLGVKNQGRLNNCFDQWLGMPTHRRERECHPIHNTLPNWQNLRMPVPARGLFGIVTIGVHLTMYTTQIYAGREVVDRVWVSRRAWGDDVTYPGMLDQVVAGGMEPSDLINGRLAPGETLRREADEEAGLVLDLDTKMMHTKTGTPIGRVEKAPAISFYDCKGPDAGHTSEGHLEPGVRFVYDLKLLDPYFEPESCETASERMEFLTVDAVKASLYDKRWKPNCGLVMLDFLLRKNIVTRLNDENWALMEEELHRSLPFKFAQDRFPCLSAW